MDSVNVSTSNPKSQSVSHHNFFVACEVQPIFQPDFVTTGTALWSKWMHIQARHRLRRRLCLDHYNKPISDFCIPNFEFSLITIFSKGNRNYSWWEQCIRWMFLLFYGHLIFSILVLRFVFNESVLNFHLQRFQLSCIILCFFILSNLILFYDYNLDFQLWEFEWF